MYRYHTRTSSRSGNGDWLGSVSRVSDQPIDIYGLTILQSWRPIELRAHALCSSPTNIDGYVGLLRAHVEVNLMSRLIWDETRRDETGWDSQLVKRRKDRNRLFFGSLLQVFHANDYSGLAGDSQKQVTCKGQNLVLFSWLGTIRLFTLFLASSLSDHAKHTR